MPALLLPGETLGLKANLVTDLITQMDRGFSFKTLQRLADSSGISVSTIAQIIGIPDRTFARRKVAGRLSPDESERLLRLSSIYEKAVDLFEGNVPSAVKWLTGPRREFEGYTPLAYSRTEIGAREVEDLIGRLEFGVFS
jgi:putative toxin-antitoxin system antitoxin component (TIGR02293 family)